MSLVNKGEAQGVSDIVLLIIGLYVVMYDSL